MKNSFLSNLNSIQQEAVLTIDSPLLIVAGAGSGKTSVITHKIAFLIGEKKYSSLNVLGVTFTNQAANEMKGRIHFLSGISSNLFSISTFHSLGLRILRESGQLLGFDNNWQIIDEKDQKHIIERISKDSFKNCSNDFIEDCRRKLNLAKMNLCYPNDNESLFKIGFREDEIQIFSQYHEYQKRNKFWDYEDLVSFSVKLLQNHDSCRKKYKNRFQYVVVDEFQDTNPNQYELIKLLAGEHRNITVVGDDDQAVYSWRGASIRFLFEFERDFPGTRILKLEQNYRSTQPILDFANCVIKSNLLRRNKLMWTDKKDGNCVFLIYSGSKEDEAEKISDLICRLKAKHTDFFPLAILYRINSQSLAFETEFLKKKIPFKILKGTRFFERMEVKNCIALLKLVMNPHDDISFLRMIEFLPLGIGPKTLESLTCIAREKKQPLFFTLKNFFKEKFNSRNLFEKIDLLNQNRNNFKFFEILNTILQDTQYLEILKERNDYSRLLNVNELINFIRTWEMNNSSCNFADLLDRISLESHEKNEGIDAPIYLLTMHNAKGTEFNTVIVAGINAIYMPFFLRKKFDELEEERRLFYVGCTRAKKNLVISTGSYKASGLLAEVDHSFYTPVSDVKELYDLLIPQKYEKSRKSFSGFLEHPVFGKGKIIKELKNKTFLIDFDEKGELLIDTKVVKVNFL